jgi:hypothetical protein|tara:strand:+ start:826 stop:1059 length:234 start_codon:yes stop_codon:yes gene_type:complete
MAPDLQHYYEETFNTMSTEGWKYLIEDFEEIKVSLNNLSTVNDTQTLFYRQGQLDIIELILGRKATCEKVFEELEDE